ncbi:hypothetical protein ACQEVX_24145 [Streptomyces syringium]|uniref:hypothetical protein n=1 Tax=Streptomyces syringium TaxID=76729 RepID=UPI003D90B2D1
MLRHVIAPERFFTQVSNEIIRHPRLSANAVRLLIWQLSLPASVDAPLYEAGKAAGITKGAFTRAKRELKAEGYVHEWRLQVERGKWRTTQLVSPVVLTDTEAVAVRDGSPQVTPTAPKPATGEPTDRPVGRHPTNTEGKKDNPPSQPSQPSHVPAPLIERGGLILTSVSHQERKLRFNGRDIQQLAALAGEWLLRGATAKDLREALTDGLPARVHSPAALAHNRLTRKMPEPPPFTAPLAAPQPLRTCAGTCDRVFRPVGDETACRDCRQDDAQAAYAQNLSRSNDQGPRQARWA